MLSQEFGDCTRFFNTSDEPIHVQIGIDIAQHRCAEEGAGDDAGGDGGGWRAAGDACGAEEEGEDSAECGEAREAEPEGVNDLLHGHQ